MSYGASAIGQIIYSRINSIVPVYPNIAPQNMATPYLVYTILNVQSDDVKDGTSWADTVTVLLSTYEDTVSGAASNANLVRSQLDGWAGIVNGIVCDSICYLTEASDYDPDALKHVLTQEYKIRVLNQTDITMIYPDITTLSGKTGDFSYSALIPAGYLLTALIFNNSTANQAQLSAGTSAGGFDLFTSEIIIPSTITTITIDKLFSTSATTNLYIHHGGSGDSWNGATLTIYAVLMKIT